MDRSNIGYLLSVAKHSRRLKLAISRSKHQNPRLQIIISIDIHQRVSHGKSHHQREITFSNMTIFVAIEVFATKPEVVFRIFKRYLRDQLIII